MINNETNEIYENNIIPNLEEILKKYEYCSMGNSLTQDRRAMEDGLIPEQKYRNSLVNLHSIIGTLKEFYFGQQKLDMDLEKKKIQIDKLSNEIETGMQLIRIDTGELRSVTLDEYEKKEKEVDLRKMKLELEEIEMSRKLQTPLVKDAVQRFYFFEKYIGELEKEIEENGSRSFEEATLEYHRLKSLENLRGDLLSRRLGVDKGSLEYASRYGTDISELLTIKEEDIVKSIESENFNLYHPLVKEILDEKREERKSLEVSRRMKLIVLSPETNPEKIQLATNINQLLTPKNVSVDLEVVKDVYFDFHKYLESSDFKNYNLTMFMRHDHLIPTESIPMMIENIRKNVLIIATMKKTETEDSMNYITLNNLVNDRPVIIINKFFSTEGNFPFDFLHNKEYLTDIMFGKVDFKEGTLSFNDIIKPLPKNGESLDLKNWMTE